MSNQKTNKDATVILGHSEKIFVDPESYRKIATEFEGASCAISSLGALIKTANTNQLDECTFEGIGCLLQILGEHLLNNCLKVLDVADEVPKQRK